MELEELKRLPEWKRKQIRLGRRGAYTNRPRYSPDELVTWLHEHGVRSANVLRKLCRETSESPTVYSCFVTLGVGSWREVMECVWGVEPPGFLSRKKVSHEELIATNPTYQRLYRRQWAETAAATSGGGHPDPAEAASS